MFVLALAGRGRSELYWKREGPKPQEARPPGQACSCMRGGSGRASLQPPGRALWGEQAVDSKLHSGSTALVETQHPRSLAIPGDEWEPARDAGTQQYGCTGPSRGLAWVLRLPPNAARAWDWWPELSLPGYKGLVPSPQHTGAVMLEKLSMCTATRRPPDQSRHQQKRPGSARRAEGGGRSATGEQALPCPALV